MLSGLAPVDASLFLLIGHDGHGGVLSVLMSPQIHFSLERFLTQVTSEGFVAGMFSHVRYQVRRLAESLCTHGTFVGLFSCNKRICQVFQWFSP